MPNPYFSTVNPYFQQLSPQDQQGLNPVFQNIAQQQQNQNAAMQQSNALTQGAGQAFQQGGGTNPMAMAMALRGQKTKMPGLGQTTDAQGNIIPDPTYGTGNAYNNMSGNEISNMMQNGI